LEEGELEYESIGKFLAVIKKEFGGGEKKLVKVAELKRLEQEGMIMEEFVQEFRRAVRGSGYEGRLLVEDFKRKMNKAIKRKLMKAERLPISIEQWYKWATNLDRYWKKSITNFIQLVSSQPVDQFSQTKLRWKAPNGGYLHICGMYKSNNK